MQLNRSIQYNDKSNSNTTQQSITEITNACKILYTFIELTSNKTDNSRTTVTRSVLNESETMQNVSVFVNVDQ